MSSTATTQSEQSTKVDTQLQNVTRITVEEVSGDDKVTIVEEEEEVKHEESPKPESPYLILAKQWEGITINPEFIELWHINKIDNVPVSTYIRKHNGGMQLNIVARHVKDATAYYENPIWKYYQSSNMFYHTVEDMADILENMANVIGALRYDKYNSKLDLPKVIKANEAMITVFGASFSTVESRVETCCICHEDTCVHTSCGHYVCVPCADAYIETSRIAKCPICRNKNGLGKMYTCRDRYEHNYTRTEIDSDEE